MSCEIYPKVYTNSPRSGAFHAEIRWFKNKTTLNSAQETREEPHRGRPEGRVSEWVVFR